MWTFDLPKLRPTNFEVILPYATFRPRPMLFFQKGSFFSSPSLALVQQERIRIASMRDVVVKTIYVYDNIILYEALMFIQTI